MNRFAFYGLRRSGNHAILEWLIQNMGGSGSRKVIFNRRLIAVNSAAYINEINSYGNKKEMNLHYETANKNYENLLVSYEDTSIDYSVSLTKEYDKIVIVRDIENLFASRFKKGQSYKQPYNLGDMRIDEITVDLWKNHVEAGLNKNAILIQFEKWVDSKEYRDHISKILGFYNYDKIDTITEFGEGSSFSGQRIPTAEELKTRASQVELPEKVKDRISQEDILELRKKLGYI